MFLLPHSVGSATLVRKLGTGGVAESYLGTQEGGRQVVVRRLLPFVLRDPARLASIEARILDLLGVRHPFLVHVLDHLTEGEEQFIVEEYVNGVTLEQVLTWCRQSGHVVPHNVFLNIATQICNGLEALHGRSGKGSSAEHVLHLAIKPSAIFLSTEGKVLVGAYGLTRSPTTFPQGGVAGPVPARMEYLSPEQTHPDQKLTPASDVFGLGAVLYELLTLESLFRAESNLQTIHRVRRAEVTTPLLKVKERMPGLDKVLFRALSLNPRHRYQRAFVLREDLRGLMAGYSFATISEDTRAFLQPILAGAAGPPSAGYVVGLDDAPESPSGADSFAESPNTRIDPDPMSTAASAASALAERVARERAAEVSVERTERTDVSPEGDLAPLPPPVRLGVPPASPTWLPDADTMRDLHAEPPHIEAIGGDTTLSGPGPILLSKEPVPEVAVPQGMPPEPARLEPPPPPPEVADPPLLRPAGTAEIPPSSTGAFLSGGKGKKKKDRAAPLAMVSAFDAPSVEIPRTASPTLAPAPSPFAPPRSRDVALPVMAANADSAVPRAPGTAPTLSPEPGLGEHHGQATVATPAPEAVYPTPVTLTPPEPVVHAPAAPAQPSPRLAKLPPPAARSAPPTPVRRAEPDPLDEPPSPNRGPLFATVTMAGLAAVLLCSGVGYWGYNQYTLPRATSPLAAAPPQVGAPDDDPAAILAATGPDATKPPPAAPLAASNPPATPAATPVPPPVAKAEPPPAPRPVVTPEPKPEPKPVAKPEPVAKATPKPEPKPKPVAKAEPVAKVAPTPKPAPAPKPAPEPKVVAKVEPKPAPAPVVAKVDPPRTTPPPTTSRTSAKPAAAPLPDASLTITPEPEAVSLDSFVAAAKAGRLDSDDVLALEGTSFTDTQYTRSRALLVMNAQKKGDDAGVHKYLDQALSLPENEYNPVFLADYARWHVNRGEYDKALEKAGKAERYWARLPSDLVFSKKAEIYEVEAAAWQGKFYKSGEDPELLDNAVHGWEKYRTHVSTKDRTDLVKKADEQLAKLNDIRTRLQ